MIYSNLSISLVQVATSVARLLAFAFAVLTIGKISTDKQLTLLIGYLPYFAFFDILIQSTSRAFHLRSGRGYNYLKRARLLYAWLAISLLALLYVAGIGSTGWRITFLFGAWPLGAVGYVWEKYIAQRQRQLLLALVELAILASSIALYLIAHLPWPILLMCIVSFPVARLIALTMPAKYDPRVFADEELIGEDGRQQGAVAISHWQMGAYVAASLAQQVIAATASSLPAIYVQLTGDARHLAVYVTVFRSLNSLAAVVSLTINSMSSRIFYRQTGSGIEGIELRMLASWRIILAVAVGLAAIAAVMAIVLPHNPAAFSFMILPIMAMINAESSMAYNRGYPQGTVHCQILIFLLSLSFLFVLLQREASALAALSVFAIYLLVMVPHVLRTHRRILERQFAR
jgi:hypothetical protein